MKPSVHLATSAALGLALSPWTGATGAVACVVAGTLIDLDHLFDFYREGRRWHGRRDFEDFFYQHRMRHLVLPLHGWEWAALGAAALLAAGRVSPELPVLAIFWAAWAGAAFHLLCDSFANPLPPRGYFFFWRARRGFLVSRLIPAALAEPASAPNAAASGMPPTDKEADPATAGSFR